MAYKTSKNTYTSPSKKNESEAEDKANTSKESVEGKARSKPKKKYTKQRFHQKFNVPPPSVVATQTFSRVPRNLALMPVIPTMIPVSTVAPYYARTVPCQYTNQNPYYNYPVTVNDWNKVISSMQNPIYTMAYHHVPVVMPPQLVCPYTCPLRPPQPILAPAIPPPVIIEEIPTTTYTYPSTSTFSPEQKVPVIEDYRAKDEIEAVDAEATLYDASYKLVQYNPKKEPLETYLTLPRQLFPTARMLTMDPNPIIDVFCKISNIHNHAPWILDLEFGVPRVPITRPIPIYDVKFNSVHCKNTPNAIHPGFESCSQEFKNTLLFYYDCIVSSWYRGYVHMNSDHSVENFQSWMQVPMLVFGMCWP